jgi:hypothetical protein
MGLGVSSFVVFPLPDSDDRRGPQWLSLRKSLTVRRRATSLPGRMRMTSRPASRRTRRVQSLESGSGCVCQCQPNFSWAIRLYCTVVYLAILINIYRLKLKIRIICCACACRQANSTRRRWGRPWRRLPMIPPRRHRTTRRARLFRLFFFNFW